MASAVGDRTSSSNPKGTINLRVEAHTRQLIDAAAQVLGKTHTEFMVESARRRAIHVLLDQRLLALDDARHDAFVQALDTPPPPRAEAARAPEPHAGVGAVTDEAEQQASPQFSAPVLPTAEHDLSAFDCGDLALNDWLRDRALTNESRFSRTYVVCEGSRAIAHVCTWPAQSRAQTRRAGCAATPLTPFLFPSSGGSR